VGHKTRKEDSMSRLTIAIPAIAGIAALLCATPFSIDWSHKSGVSLSLNSAQARIGRPLTPGSVAGVNRRVHRRAYYGAAVGAAAVGAAAAGAYYARPACGYYPYPPCY
jgi:hypothetical protein